jgi:hypothetical protein
MADGTGRWAASGSYDYVRNERNDECTYEVSNTWTGEGAIAAIPFQFNGEGVITYNADGLMTVMFTAACGSPFIGTLVEVPS